MSPLPSGSMPEILPSQSCLGWVIHEGVVGFQVRELFLVSELPPMSGVTRANGLAGLRLGGFICQMRMKYLRHRGAVGVQGKKCQYLISHPHPRVLRAGDPLLTGTGSDQGSGYF